MEVYTSNTGNHCSNGAEREFKTRSNGQYVYLAGCRSGTGTVQLQTASGTVIRTYTFTIGSSATPTPTQTSTPVPPTATRTPTPRVVATSTPTHTPTATQQSGTTASLSPDPSTVNFRPDGRWHRFTVNSSGTVRIYTNPGTTPLNVEVYTSNTGNHCSNGAEREFKTRSNGQYVYLAGCRSGTGTVQLQTASGTVIRTYTFTIGSSATNTPVPPTATRTPVAPTATRTPVAPTATHTPVAPTATHTPTITPLAGNSWQARIFSRRQSNGYEYGFKSNGRGRINPSVFGFNGTHFHIDDVLWNSRRKVLTFDLDECLKPSEFVSLRLGSRTFDDPNEAASGYSTDAQCNHRSRNQRFEFDTTVNPLPRDENVNVTLTLSTGSSPGPTPTDTPAPTATRTPMPTHTPTGPTPTPTHTPTGHIPTPTATATPECPSSKSRGNAVGLSTCPLPTPLPSCSPVQSGTLTSDGTGNEITKSGSWVSGCQLGTSGINARYTYYYSFKLTRPTHVNMELTGGSNVHLRKGFATSGSTVEDHDLRTQNYSAEIIQSGYYTAAIINPSNSGSFTLKIEGRVPWLGHQKDNKVKYRVGTVQPTRTPQPTSATPNPVPDPAVTIPTAIPTAVTAWNKAVATPSPNVLFESASNEEVIINMARGGTSIIPGHDHRRDPWLVLDEPHCGKTYACVKPKNLSIFPAQWTAAAYNWLIPILGDHMPEMVMALEEPAWYFKKTGLITGDFTRYFWIKDASRHGSLVSTSDLAEIPGIDSSKTYKWAHAPGVIMHEFGHTAGLTDLYNYTGYNFNRLMHTNYGVDAIPSKDIEYMRQVYDGHSPH